jgi:hypothetical protein
MIDSKRAYEETKPISNKASVTEIKILLVTQQATSVDRQ